jgi:hypothetical protein
LFQENEDRTRLFFCDGNRFLKADAGPRASHRGSHPVFIEFPAQIIPAEEPVESALRLFNWLLVKIGRTRPA